MSKVLIFAALAWLACSFTLASPVPFADLKSSFVRPPASARPWVYWFWLNGNITRYGIRADLEAMQRVGIGGVLIMEVDQGTPKGKVDFGGLQWREMFKYVCSEAHRLGLQVNMTNDAGWCGSGGPWITPELSMKKVVWSETHVIGGQNLQVQLAQPETVRGFYRDIDVVAFPTPADDTYRIADIRGKSALDIQEFPPAPAKYPVLPASQVIPGSSVLHLVGQVQNGVLNWSAPPGNWTVLRMGYTSTGVENHPAPQAGLGLESDKLSKAATLVQFTGLMAKLLADNKADAGSTLVSTHIDSWETGSQNWTGQFRHDFMRLRGYDPLDYLPVLTGRVVGSLEISERFLWDMRLTVSQLLDQNYAGSMEELAGKHGIRLSVEAYGSPTDDLAYAGRADEPMSEFWATGQAGGTTDEMASAAHTYGKPILGAESFTSDSSERWRYSPASLKQEADWALCDGVNRFVFHRYAMQPWPSNPEPGMSMGPWGLHYERTETWWEMSKPWHQYLARCQYMLRQGHFVADIAYLQAEGSPRAFRAPVAGQGDLYSTRPGYNFDGCDPEVVLNRMTVKHGLLTLPDGMTYRLLSLPNAQTMTPELLARVSELVRAGATIVGGPPLKSPSLTDYPECDARVQRLASDLWGDCDGKTVFGRRFGRGRVVWGRTPEQVLQGMGVAPDFTTGVQSGFRYVHRSVSGGTDIYFVANKLKTGMSCNSTFRVAGSTPEYWWPETGKIEPVPVYTRSGTLTQIPISLEGAQSVFVVFKPGSSKPLLSAAAYTDLSGRVPALSDVNIARAVYGVLGDPARTLDVREKLQSLVNQGDSQIKVSDMAAGYDPAYGIVKTLQVDYTVAGRQYHVSGSDPETVEIQRSSTPLPMRIVVGSQGAVLEAWQNGRFTVTATDGRLIRYRVANVPKLLDVSGPWTVSFPPHLGAPTQIRMSQLESWSDDSLPGVRYFSGTATYTTTFSVAHVGPDERAVLDLGDVKDIAEVQVNGKNLGILWHTPYRVDVTAALRFGVNRLSIKVTNLWINRMIGDEELDRDSDRNDDGTLKAWPDLLLASEPSPSNRITFTSWQLWRKSDPLQPSGLLGPVTVRFSRNIVVSGQTGAG